MSALHWIATNTSHAVAVAEHTGPLHRRWAVVTTVEKWFSATRGRRRQRGGMQSDPLFASTVVLHGALGLGSASLQKGRHNTVPTFALHRHDIDMVVLLSTCHSATHAGDELSLKGLISVEFH